MKCEGEEMINWHKIKSSSQIDQIAYDPAEKRLHVKFHGGGHYSYADVPQEHFDAMKSAKSSGGYLHANIKGKFKHEKHDGQG